MARAKGSVRAKRPSESLQRALVSEPAITFKLTLVVPLFGSWLLGKIVVSSAVLTNVRGAQTRNHRFYPNDFTKLLSVFIEPELAQMFRLIGDCSVSYVHETDTARIRRYDKVVDVEINFRTEVDSATAHRVTNVFECWRRIRSTIAYHDMAVLGRAITGLTSANVSVATAYITDISPEDKRARRFGLFNAMFGIGFIIGPVLAA